MKSKLLLVLLAMKSSLLLLQDVKIPKVIQICYFFVLETLFRGKLVSALFRYLSKKELYIILTSSVQNTVSQFSLLNLMRKSFILCSFILLINFHFLGGGLKLKECIDMDWPSWSDIPLIIGHIE